MNRLVCAMAMSLLLWPACSVEQKPASKNENKEAEAARHERKMDEDKIGTQLRDLDQEIDALRAKMGKQNKVDRK
ncbi:MAG: hypothetical protein ACLQVM_22520 [Terriglobia bacterium]